MRIALVAHKLPPYSLGGVEVYTHNLAQALKADHRVSVFFRHDDRSGPEWAEQDREVDGVFTRQVSHHPGGLGGSPAGEFLHTFLNRRIEASFERFIAETRPDVVHVQHVMALSAGLLRTAVPTILTLHDYWFICGNSQLIWPDGQVCRGKALGMNCVRCAAAARFPSPLATALRPVLAPLFLYRDRVVRQAALRARLLCSPSRFLVERYIAAGFPAERFRVLENGIPVERLRRFPRVPSGGPLRVTYLGSIAWQKGVHLLVEAFNRLPAGAARLRMWGDPAVFPQYAERVRAAIAGPDARLMGPIANERVGEVLADSDVVVVPSLWYENSPVVIQEARALGVPVVAAGHGALAEKVRHEVDGLLFPPGDAAALAQALRRLVDEPGLLARLRAAVPPPADMAGHVQELVEVYSAVRRGLPGQRRDPSSLGSPE